MSEYVQQIRKLEEALCQAHGKLFAIQNACEQVIIDSEEAMDTVTDGSEGIYEGRAELASQILFLSDPDNQLDPDDHEQHNQRLREMERGQ